MNDGNSEQATVDLPFVSCLCPTYRRPALLANSMACFVAQDYPADRRELIILDDAGQLQCCRHDGWEVISIPRRFQSLPEKFNAIAGLAKGEILFVWEDDDIYLPWHLSAHVESLRGSRGYSKPSRVRSHFHGEWREEDASGRFHASIGFTRALFDSVGGWPLTHRGDFDQQFMAQLAQAGPPVDPVAHQPPSYVFRWEATNAYHGQGLMQSPSDEGWYQRACDVATSEHPIELFPEFDSHTLQCFAVYGLLPPFLAVRNPVPVETARQMIPASPPIVESTTERSTIPIYINNRDRLTTTKQLVEDCLRFAGARPIIVDNDSTYPPLLEWYKSQPCEIVFLGDNCGPRAPWQVLSKQQDFSFEFYVVTDSDLDLSRVPDNVIDLLLAGMQRYPWAVKCGLSLEINDIPEGLPRKQQVLNWESKFWTERVDDQFWKADIDTTFAMYRTSPPWDGAYGPSLRADRPYVARHTPWYVTSPDEEEIYYLEHLDPAGATWSVDVRQDLIAAGRLPDLKPRSQATVIDESRVLEICKAIPGWMEDPELVWIFQKAREVPIGGIWVELGSWNGRSLMAAGLGLRDGCELWGIDHFRGSPEHQPLSDETVGLACIKNLNVLKGMRPGLQCGILVSDVTAAAQRFANESVHTTFIDANHEYEAVTSQIKAWRPKITSDGRLCGHDYNRRDWPGVTRAVVELLPGTESGPCSIWNWNATQPPVLQTPVATLSVIISTIGRSSLQRTLESVRQQDLIPGDEIFVIHDGPMNPEVECVWNESGLPGRLVALDDGPHRDWGAAARTVGIAMATGSHLIWQDDDDTYLPGAFSVIRRECTQEPEAFHLFRMAYPNGWLLWQRPDIASGNVSTQIFVAPRKLPLGEWGRHYAGDYDFIASTIERNPTVPVRFIDRVIVMFSRSL